MDKFVKICKSLFVLVAVYVLSILMYWAFGNMLLRMNMPMIGRSSDAELAKNGIVQIFLLPAIQLYSITIAVVAVIVFWKRIHKK